MKSPQLMSNSELERWIDFPSRGSAPPGRRRRRRTARSDGRPRRPGRVRAAPAAPRPRGGPGRAAPGPGASTPARRPPATPCPGDVQAARPCRARGRVEQPGLADAGLADEEQGLALALARSRERRLERGRDGRELPLATDEQRRVHPAKMPQLPPRTAACGAASRTGCSRRREKVCSPRRRSSEHRWNEMPSARTGRHRRTGGFVAASAPGCCGSSRRASRFGWLVQRREQGVRLAPERRIRGGGRAAHAERADMVKLEPVGRDRRRCPVKPTNVHCPPSRRQSWLRTAAGT